MMAFRTKVKVASPVRDAYFAKVDEDNNWSIDKGQMSRIEAGVEKQWLALVALEGANEPMYHPYLRRRWADRLLKMLPGSEILTGPPKRKPKGRPVY